MRPFLPSPMNSLFWGWRCAAWGYIGIAAFGATMSISTFCPTNPGFDDPPMFWHPGAVDAWLDCAHLAATDQAPRVDPGTGLVSIPSDDWRAEGRNEGVLAVLRREGTVSPTFKDRIIDPVAIAAAFDRDPGFDMGDGGRGIRVGDLSVSLATAPDRGCRGHFFERLRCGSRSFPVGDRYLRIVTNEGHRLQAIDRRHDWGYAWVPLMSAVRARIADDGRTLWLRGTDVESQRWIITADLVTATVIQIDADPAE